MTLETKSGEYRDVLEAKYLVTLAESIFTVWRGALAERRAIVAAFTITVPGETTWHTEDVHPTIPLLRMLHFPGLRYS